MADLELEDFNEAERKTELIATNADLGPNQVKRFADSVVLLIRPTVPSAGNFHALRGIAGDMRSSQGLIVPSLLLLTTLGQAGPTLYFDQLTRETDACWRVGSTIVYHVAGRCHELPAKAVHRIDGQVPEGVLQANQFNLTSPGAPASAAPPSALGLGFQAAQLGAGAYGLATGEMGTPAHAASAANLVGGAAGLAGSAAAGIAPSALAALAPLGPAMGRVSRPLILGPIVERLTRGDRARFPENFSRIPGTGRAGGAQAVDPSSGAILEYRGNEQYGWSTQTQNRQRATPEQMRQWQIAPTGQLAQDPAYANVGRLIQQDQMQTYFAGTPPPGSPPGTGVAPGTVPPPVETARNYLAEQRLPVIERLRLQYPNAPENEIWRLYTLTPEYQEELALSGQLMPEARTGEGR
jgi:hypothetical protein